MLEDGDLDCLTGDYLAELTMLILGRDQAKDPNLGYAKTFLTQLRDCLGLAVDRGVTVVANAGGLNPAGLAGRLREIAAELGLAVSVAHVEGDDLRPRASELGLLGADGMSPLTANAYLGAFGIAEALRAGAVVVVTGRVTDASLVVGPAIAAHRWGRDDFDQLAGAVAAGHVVECGAQATGGNFSGFTVATARGADLRHPGFPIAEVAADGSSVITKHPGTGGTVTVDTVTAQLVYEIGHPAYLGPDVTTHLGSLRLTAVDNVMVLADGTRTVIDWPPHTEDAVALRTLQAYTAPEGPYVQAPLGLVADARSGDKGGDANIGVWVHSPQWFGWLWTTLRPDRIAELLPETAGLDVDVHALPNLGAVNIVVHGLLGDGVAASTRTDPQAKALGEWLRARHVDVPVAMLDEVRASASREVAR